MSVQTVWVPYQTEQTIPEIDTWLRDNKIPSLFSPILYKRNITTIEEVEKLFYGELSDTHSPLEFGEPMYKGVYRLQQAFERKEKIVIFGDYDCDGTTGTSLVMTVLSRLQSHYGFSLEFMIPDRFKEGYGLNDNNIQRLISVNPDLVITVDCGISSGKQISELKKVGKGIDVIVTDHHSPKSDIPTDAVAIIHPSYCEYPEQTLCGCAVAYQFMKGIWEVNGKPAPDWVTRDQLDLVACGTVVDIMELKGDNRIYVKEGIKKIFQGDRPAFLMMKQIQKWKKVDGYTLGFNIGPRINAAGRMKSADQVITLLTSTNKKEIRDILLELEEHNSNRKAEQEKVVKSGMKQMEKPMFPYVSVIKGKYHEGVVGIAAAKIVEAFYRPTFVLAEYGDIAKGSARSIPDVHLFNLMQKHEHLLEGWGGHAMAAGLTIAKNNIQPFFQALNDELATMPDTTWIKKNQWEGELEGADLSDHFFIHLLKMAPYGQGFPQVTWKVRGYLLPGKALDADRKVGKIQIGSRSFPFAMWEKASKVNFSELCELYGTWEWSDFHSKMQFVAIDTVE